MKAKIKATGEIVDITSYNDISTTSILKYLVSYIDSQGVEHGREGTNYYLDFEPVDNLTHWQYVRERAAIAAMQGILSNSINRFTKDSLEIIPRNAILISDELVEQLKKEKA